MRSGLDNFTYDILELPVQYSTGVHGFSTFTASPVQVKRRRNLSSKADLPEGEAKVWVKKLDSLTEELKVT